MNIGATTQTLTRTVLRAGDFPQATDVVTILASEGALVKGAIFTKNTDGKYRKFNAANSDGSENVDSSTRILAGDITVGVTDETTTGIRTGEFNETLVNASTGITLSAAQKATLEKRCLFFKPISS